MVETCENKQKPVFLPLSNPTKLEEATPGESDRCQDVELVS